MSSPTTLIALLHGPDQPGLVARVAGWIFERGGNILLSDQHRDREMGLIFQRLAWDPTGGDHGADTAGFHKVASALGRQAPLPPATQNPRRAQVVRRAAHWLPPWQCP